LEKYGTERFASGNFRLNSALAPRDKVDTWYYIPGSMEMVPGEKKNHEMNSNAVLQLKQGNSERYDAVSSRRIASLLEQLLS